MDNVKNVDNAEEFLEKLSLLLLPKGGWYCQLIQGISLHLQSHIDVCLLLLSCRDWARLWAALSASTLSFEWSHFVFLLP